MSYRELRNISLRPLDAVNIPCNCINFLLWHVFRKENVFMAHTAFDIITGAELLGNGHNKTKSFTSRFLHFSFDIG